MQIGTVKFKVKKAVAPSLPELPDEVERKLFLQGRDAWTYRWYLLDQDARNPRHPISVEVEAKLKKEFMQYQLRTRYMFVCELQLQPDIYKAKVSVHEKEV